MTERAPSEAPPLPVFAGQPTMVLASQKDAAHARELRSSVYGATDAVMGPTFAEAVKPELNFLSDAAYYLLTMGRGRQTLGEEYVDVLPVGVTTIAKGVIIQGLPSHRARLFAVLLTILGPYLMARLETRGWDRVREALSGQSARDRARALMRRQLLGQQQATANESQDSKSNSGSETLVSRAYKALVDFIKYAAAPLWWLSLATYASRLHLGIFYWYGDYLNPALRVMRIRHVSTRESPNQQPSYYVLGAFVVTQMSFQLAAYVFDRVRTGTEAFAKSMGYPVEAPKSNAGTEALVPSLELSDTPVTSLENDWMGTCGICLSAVTNPAVPPCGHVFCYDHIVESCAMKSECPNCRQPATPQSIICIYT